MKTTLSGLALALVCVLGCGGSQQAEPEAPMDPVVEPEPAAPAPAPDDAVPADAAIVAPPAPASPARPPTPAASFADAANGFAMDLWGKLRERSGNLVVSPASVWMALAMTHEGARAETADEMTRALRMPADAEAARRDAAARVVAWNAHSRGELTVKVVNRLFGEKAFRFERAFMGSMQSRWRAPLEKVSFRTDAEAARGRINSWVARETRDRIRDLVPPGSIDGETRLALVNAVYFLGRWEETFQQRGTHDEAFFVAPGQGVPVPTMHQTAPLKYAEAAGVQVLEMAYREGPFAMTFVLPRTADGLAALEASLDAPTLAAWVGALQMQEVRVSLPKFTIDTPTSLALSDVLRALGVQHAFDRATADFTGIAVPPTPDDRLVISQVFHKAFVKVDEQGTEAAAGLAVIMARVGAGPGPRPAIPEFRADHPFLFYLRDTESGVVLFAGRLADPR